MKIVSYTTNKLLNWLIDIKGAPWEIQDQGDARVLTHWEQIDYGIQFTRTRKFLTIAPIVL